MDDDLASLLASGERATFHGPPGAAVTALQQAVLLAGEHGQRAEASAAAWLLGVALEAAGRFGAALTVLEPLVDTADSDEAEARLFGALAAATTASVERQLGRHEQARAHDEMGLRVGSGLGDPEAECLLGLASDAVGLGDLGEARARLAAADPLVGDRGDRWRQAVRRDWVRAEIALLAEEPAEAAAAAAGAVERAERARAPRHVATGLLFQGVAEVHDPAADAAATLRRAATLAEGLGALPVVWQARALLGALTEGPESVRSLAAARSAALTIAGDLPDGVREEWLARPNVAALLEA